MNKQIAFVTSCFVISLIIMALGILQIIFVRRVHLWSWKIMPFLFWPIDLLNKTLGLKTVREQIESVKHEPSSAQLIIGRIGGIFMIVCGLIFLVIGAVALV
jgi:hypothetical protein